MKRFICENRRDASTLGTGEGGAPTDSFGPRTLNQGGLDGGLIQFSDVDLCNDRLDGIWRPGGLRSISFRICHDAPAPEADAGQSADGSGKHPLDSSVQETANSSSPRWVLISGAVVVAAADPSSAAAAAVVPGEPAVGCAGRRAGLAVPSADR